VISIGTIIERVGGQDSMLGQACGGSYVGVGKV
jgi:hypothetical protein